MVLVTKEKVKSSPSVSLLPRSLSGTVLPIRLVSSIHSSGTASHGHSRPSSHRGKRVRDRAILRAESI